jgi:hypothetical protein
MARVCLGGSLRDEFLKLSGRRRSIEKQAWRLGCKLMVWALLRVKDIGIWQHRLASFSS